MPYAVQRCELVVNLQVAPGPGQSKCLAHRACYRVIRHLLIRAWQIGRALGELLDLLSQICLGFRLQLLDVCEGAL